jgi:ribosomal protein L29
MFDLSDTTYLCARQQSRGLQIEWTTAKLKRLRRKLAKLETVAAHGEAPQKAEA